MRDHCENKKLLMKIYKRLYKVYGPQEWWPGDTPLEMIIGAILTQNTAWTNVEKAIKNLKKLRLLSSPSDLKRIKTGRLAALIRPAGYYNIKAKRLKSFINFLSSKYSLSLKKLSRENTGRLRQELLTVNGIGPETCDSILLYAFNRPIFVVDAYTQRILTRHRVLKENEGYDAVQKMFMEALPKNSGLFNEYHALIVRTGKEFCKKAPKCDSCPLKGKDFYSTNKRSF